MAIQNNYNTVANGDQLNEGYFNGGKVLTENAIEIARVPYLQPLYGGGTSTFRTIFKYHSGDVDNTYVPRFGYDPVINNFFSSTTGSPSTTEGSGLTYASSGTLVLNGFNSGSQSVTSGVVIPDYDIMESYDDYNSSIDSTIWTTSGTVSEGASSITVGGTTSGVLTTQGSGNQNLISYNLFEFYGALRLRRTASGALFKLEADDGTTQVSLISLEVGNVDSGTKDLYVRIRKFDNDDVAEVTFFWDYEVSTQMFSRKNLIDISSLNGTTFRLKFTLSRGSSGDIAQLNLSKLLLNKASPTSTVQAAISPDNSTFTDVNSKEFTQITSGTDPAARLTITVGTDEYVSINNVFTEFR